MAITRNTAPTVSEGDISFKTAVALSSYLYCFVNVAAGLITGSGNSSAFVAGILQDYPVPDATVEPNAESNATVRLTGLSLLKLGLGGCAVGDYLECDASGRGTKVVNGKDYHAVALSTGVINDLVLVRLEHGHLSTTP